jgi:hypothetical protein
VTLSSRNSRTVRFSAAHQEPPLSAVSDSRLSCSARRTRHYPAFTPASTSCTPAAPQLGVRVPELLDHSFWDAAFAAARSTSCAPGPPPKREARLRGPPFLPAVWGGQTIGRGERLGDDRSRIAAAVSLTVSPGIALPEVRRDVAEPGAAVFIKRRPVPSVGSARCKTDRLAVESARSQRKDHVPTWLWVVIIVVVVLAVLGFFGRGRLSR